MKECIDCGKPYGAGLFLWLSDEEWVKLGYLETDYACAHCIITRIEQHDSYAYIMPGKGKDT
jgi:hypothetical protein